MNIQRKICLSFLCCLIFTCFGYAQDFELPVYEIKIDPAYLNELQANPDDKIYFPAIFKVNQSEYPCSVRLRGGTTLSLPKKSWKVQFEGKNRPFKSDVINLNAEYRDKSYMRSTLAFKLFDIMDQPAPRSKFANLFVNENYIGVYHEVEQIDEFFLDRYDKEPNDLYKAVNHGANFGILLDYDKYPITYEKKIGDGSDFAKLQQLNSQVYFFTADDFERNITNLINVDNFLKFFAIEYVIANQDGFTKDFYLYLNNSNHKFEIFPWDNDATFGNHWNGQYYGYYQLKTCYPLDYQLLFQRLIEINDYKQKFFSIMNTIITTGFDSLYSIIDKLYLQIKNDVYLDPSKGCTNHEFDAEMDTLKIFLTRRKEFLFNLDYFNKVPLTDIYCSTPYPQSENDIVTFRVKAQNTPMKVCLGYLSPDYKWEYFTPMFDDGQHDDLSPSDQIFGIRFALNGRSGIFPYFFRSYFDSSQYSHFPQNGSFYYYFNPCYCHALNITPYVPTENNVAFGKIMRFNPNPEIFCIAIKNTSETPTDSADISFCTINYKEYFYHFPIPLGHILGPGDSIWVTNKKEFLKELHPEMAIFGNLYLNIDLGDTIKLFSPGRQPIVSYIYKDEQQTFLLLEEVIINEINYNSANEFDTGDWVELYNHTGPAVDLSDWTFKDEDENHRYTFASNTLLPSDGYLVLCTDTIAFKSHFPEVRNYLGNLDFGFRADGEHLRLFDDRHFLIDYVRYDNQSPWPIEPDGKGATLALLSPDLNNTLATNWYASKGHGTPGKKNDSCYVSTRIVINEINYNSSTDFDCEDWIEFYNSSHFTVDLSGWKFTSQNAAMSYHFPENMGVDSGSYFVLCKDIAKFNHAFPDVKNCIGNFDFALKNDGDILKLYNQLNMLIDSLEYNCIPPWPSSANGKGATLELIDPEYNNALVINWTASKGYGTPGESNSPYKNIAHLPMPVDFQVFQNYPNPFNSTTKIKYTLSQESEVVIKIFNVLGQQIDRTDFQNEGIGYHHFIWDGFQYSSGIYFFSIEAQNFKQIKKMILLR